MIVVKAFKIVSRLVGFKTTMLKLEKEKDTANRDTLL